METETVTAYRVVYTTDKGAMAYAVATDEAKAETMATRVLGRETAKGTIIRTAVEISSGYGWLQVNEFEF